jgi:hypothetical protein
LVKAAGAAKSGHLSGFGHIGLDAALILSSTYNGQKEAIGMPDPQRCSFTEPVHFNRLLNPRDPCRR